MVTSPPQRLADGWAFPKTFTRRATEWRDDRQTRLFHNCQACALRAKIDLALILTQNLFSPFWLASGSLSGAVVLLLVRCLSAVRAVAEEAALLDGGAEHALLRYFLDQPVPGIIITR